METSVLRIKKSECHFLAFLGQNQPEYLVPVSPKELIGRAE